MKGTSRKRFAIAAALPFAGLALAGVPAYGARFQWKWGNDLPAEHSINVRGVEAFAKIRQETGGQLDIRAFPGSALGADASVLSQLRLGAVEMVAHAGSVLDTIVPIASIEGIAFAYPNLEAPFAAMDGDLGALIRQELLEKGRMVAIDRAFEVGWRDFTTSVRPLRTVEDLQGLKLRVSPGKLRVDTFQSLGARPTPIPPVDSYTALQTHIVDGQESPLTLIAAQRWFEVQKYCSITNHVWGGNWNLVNLDKWNSLPADLQSILRKHLNQAALLQRRDNALLTRSMQDKLARQGLIFNQPGPESFKAKLVASGFYTRWRGEYGEKPWSTLEKYTGKLGV